MANTGEEAVDAVAVDEDKEAKFFFSVSSITTQQFKNHTSSSVTTHEFIERKIRVAAGKIATNTLDFF